MRRIFTDIEVTKTLSAKRAEEGLLLVNSTTELSASGESIVVATVSTAIDVTLPTSAGAKWSTDIYNDSSSTANVSIKFLGSTLLEVEPGGSATVICKVNSPAFISDWLVSSFSLSSVSVTDGLFNNGTALGVRLSGIGSDGSGSLATDRTLDYVAGALETRLSTESGLEKSGGIRLLRVYTKTHNATTDWSGPTGGYYRISIGAVQHLQGVQPRIECYVLNGSVYDVVEPDNVSVTATGDITIYVPSEPDLRYQGKVVVQQAR